MKIRLLLLSVVATVGTMLPASPATATHACGEGLEAVCDAQHVIINKIDFLVRCKILRQC